jgi:hypothetical protein
MKPQLGNLREIVDILVEEGVEFIVVGGQAEWIFGSDRATLDVDVCYRRTAENLKRLAIALRRMNPSLRNAPPELPFILDEKTLALGDNFTFSTDFGDFDLLGYLEPIGGYDALVGHVERFQYGSHLLNVIALDDLIRIKQHIRRPKDRASLEQLLGIKRVRESGGQPDGGPQTPV